MSLRKRDHDRGPARRCDSSIALRRCAQNKSVVFRLQKDQRTAVCTLVTHPIGGEVRVTVGRELLRSEAARDGLTLVNAALAWKQQFIDKGWQ